MVIASYYLLRLIFYLSSYLPSGLSYSLRTTAVFLSTSFLTPVLFTTTHNMIGETEAIVLHYAAKGKEIYGCNPGLIKSNIRDSLHGGGTKLSIDMVITILYALCQIIFVVVLLSYQGHAYDTL